jgi:hypothetical protein
MCAVAGNVSAAVIVPSIVKRMLSMQFTSAFFFKSQCVAGPADVQLWTRLRIAPNSLWRDALLGIVIIQHMCLFERGLGRIQGRLCMSSDERLRAPQRSSARLILKALKSLHMGYCV